MSSLKNRNIAVTRYPDRYMRIIPTPEKLYILLYGHWSLYAAHQNIKSKTYCCSSDDKCTYRPVFI